MNKEFQHIIQLLKDYIGIYLSISLGIFLFVLFFQPFELGSLDFNNRLLFIAGFGVIVFLLMIIIRIVFYGYIQNYERSNREAVFPASFGNFLLMALSSAAFAFYLRFVGAVPITFHIMLKVALICASPLVILWLHEKIKAYKKQNEALLEEKENMRKQVERYEMDYQNKSVEFTIDSSGNSLILSVSDIVYFKSADNYVEIAYKEGVMFKKKLIRNTLKNVEQQLNVYPHFIRVHRTCIVNTQHIEALTKHDNNNWLIITGYEEKLPVSRQYLLKVKEVLR